MALTAAEFAAKLINPYNNRDARPVQWNRDTVRLPENGVLLSGGSSPALTDFTLSASVHADASTGATGAGLVFRGSQGANGLTGYVFQVDPGYLTNGQPSILLRQWTNGSETRLPGRVVVPTGIDPRGTNQLQVKVVGNQFVGYVNGTEVMRVQLPADGPTGTQYGARAWGSACGPNAKLSCGADISGLTVTPAQ